MKYRNARIKNIPDNPRNIVDDALGVCFNMSITEKGTEKHPSTWQRQPSDLSYEEVYKLIQSSKPHWVIVYRDNFYLTGGREKSYWEFGGCNIGSNNGYGEVFLFIQVDEENAQTIFEKYNLKVDEYG